MPLRSCRARRSQPPLQAVIVAGCVVPAFATTLPAQMPVVVDADIDVPAKTVGGLRKVTAWPENLAITTPQDRYPESAVRVSKVSVATRTSPKS